MISENDVKRAYGSANPGRVIRKGDAGWTSDRPDRAGEAYGVNPLSTMEAKMAQRRSRAVAPDEPATGLDDGALTRTGDGRDSYHWVAAGGEWRLRYTKRNGDL